MASTITPSLRRSIAESNPTSREATRLSLGLREATIGARGCLPEAAPALSSRPRNPVADAPASAGTRLFHWLAPLIKNAATVAVAIGVIGGMTAPILGTAAPVYAGTSIASSDVRARGIAAEALRTAGSISPENRFAQRNRRVLATLAKRGLPTRVDGVRIFVMGESTKSHDPHHGRSMVRAIAGKSGLGQGADIRMYESPEERGPPTYSSSVPRIISDAVEGLIDNPKDIADLVRDAHRRAPKDGRPTLVVIAIGDSINDEAEHAADATIGARKGGRLHRKAIKILHHRPTYRDYTKLFTYYQWKIASALKLPKNKNRLEANQAELAWTVEAALRDRVVVFFSAGNSNDPESPNFLGASKDTAVAPGMIVVGATDPQNDELVDWSSEGAEIALPGVNIPVGPTIRNGRASEVDGTSLSGPDAAGLAALMVKAGIHDAREIERVLTSACVSRRVGDSSSSATLAPDEVAAVIAAAKVHRRPTCASDRRS